MRPGDDLLSSYLHFYDLILEEEKITILIRRSGGAFGGKATKNIPAAHHQDRASHGRKDSLPTGGLRSAGTGAAGCRRS